MHNIAICWQCAFSFQIALITHSKRTNYHHNVEFRISIVSNCFSLKDATPLTFRTNAVHCLKRSCDKTQSYIGKTKRHLAVRVQENHSGTSGKSAIHGHISSCKDCHSCSISNFYTLAQAKMDFEAKTKEALHILFLLIYLQAQLNNNNKPDWVINAKPTYCRSLQTLV